MPMEISTLNASILHCFKRLQENLKQVTNIDREVAVGKDDDDDDDDEYSTYYEARARGKVSD
jgi:hypothetical protein